MKTLIYLAVSILLLGGVWAIHFEGFAPTRRALNSEDTPDLDSFSEPDIAAAILKREAKRLHQATADSLESARGATNGAFQSRVAECISRYELELRRQNAVLEESGLQHGLLLLYKTAHRERDFVEAYLHLAAVSPLHPTVWHWARTALAFAAECGREDEVADALNHLARFSSDRDLAEKLRSVLTSWSAARRDHAGSASGQFSSNDH